MLGGRGGKRVAPEALFYAFDLLYLDGLDLRPGTLDERRSSLATLLDGTDPNGWIRLSEEIDGDGGALLRQACALGLEGVVAKDRRRPYRSGRGTDWLKIKCVESEGFFILGYEPSSVARAGLGGRPTAVNFTVEGSTSPWLSDFRLVCWSMVGKNRRGRLCVSMVGLSKPPEVLAKLLTTNARRHGATVTDLLPRWMRTPAV